MGGRLYFIAYRATGELWRTDGTSAGTIRVKGRLLIDAPLVATSSRIYFMGSVWSGGCAAPSPSLYTSDGTTAGTRPLDAPEPYGTIAILKGKAWFGANGFEPSRRLYRSAGTDASTVRVMPKVALDEFTDIVRSNGMLFLSQGGALAISDGTGAGTGMLGQPSLGWRADVEVVAIGDTWYFPAGIGSERELWQTDGSEGGTVPVDDLDPSGNAGVRSLVGSGGSVWFSADDGTHGRELFRYTPDPLGQDAAGASGQRAYW
jgi:ELWxxDGT repeat protein